MSFAGFDAYVDSHRNEILDTLAALCRIPSVSAENGPSMADAAAFVSELSRAANLEVEMVSQPDGPPILLGQAGSGPRCLLIYNHYDVQPPDPLDEWISPPFEPRLHDGQLFARGVADNKADLVARLAALRIYQQTVGPLPVRLLYIMEGEEETGSRHLFDFARQQEALLRQVDGCLWEYGAKDHENRPVISLGVKGILSVDLVVRTASSDAHSGNGGILPNAAWRLVEALSTLRNSDGVVTVDGWHDHVQAPNAAQLALLEGIPFDAVSVERTYGLRNGLLAGLSGAAALRRLLLETTCTINGMISGYTGPGSKTVIPAQALAKLDFRLVPNLTPALAHRLLRAHLDRRGYKDVEIVDRNDGLMPSRTDPQALIAQATAAAVGEVSSCPPILQPSSAGSGPMYELCGIYDIPTASTGSGWANSRIHAPNENIRVDDFFQSIKVMGRLLQRFASLTAD